MTSVQTVPGALQDILAIVDGSASPTRSPLPRLSPDVRAWFASPDEGVVAGIELVRGAKATAQALARLTPSCVAIVGVVAGDRSCWAELARHGQGDDETCIAGLSCDPGGQVSRLVWLRAPLVPAREIVRGDLVPDGRPILESYFTALMSARFRDAAAHFTIDSIYSHPPYAGGAQRVLFHGREALWQGFAKERGPSPVRQIITGFWQDGDRAFVEGVIEGIPDGGAFFSTAQITAEGEIARYVAFYSATRVADARQFNACDTN